MSQVLYINESNHLVGCLSDHHLEKLVSLLRGRKIKHDLSRFYLPYTFYSPLFSLKVVIGGSGNWLSPLYDEKLYVRTERQDVYSRPRIPKGSLPLVRQTIDQLDVILAFDYDIVRKLRTFCAEIH